MKKSFLMFICFFGFVVFYHQSFAMNVEKKQVEKKKKRRKKKNRKKNLNLYQLNKKLIGAIIANDTQKFGTYLGRGARIEGVFNPILVKKTSGIQLINI